jgi:amino acid permease
MQCIGEMLTLWPISGALVEYVGAFVDEDLGIAVGIAYWYHQLGRPCIERIIADCFLATLGSPMRLLLRR